MLSVNWFSAVIPYTTRTTNDRIGEIEISLVVIVLFSFFFFCGAGCCARWGRCR